MAGLKRCSEPVLISPEDPRLALILRNAKGKALGSRSGHWQSLRAHRHNSTGTKATARGSPALKPGPQWLREVQALQPQPRPEKCINSKWPLGRPCQVLFPSCKYFFLLSVCECEKPLLNLFFFSPWLKEMLVHPWVGTASS